MALNEQWQKIKGVLKKFEGVKVSQKIFFVQQLGIMVRTGISLSVALKTLAEQTTSKTFRRILIDVQTEVEKGNLLSQGLEKYKRTFGELFVNMIRAGETSGKLEDVLNQLFIQMKKDHEIVSKVRGAMIYPSIVVVMMVAIGTLMMIYVVPSITAVFQEIDAPLPFATRAMIAISNFILQNGFILLLALIIVVAAITSYVRTPRGKRQFHYLLLKSPVAGRIIKKINIARFCRTISSLLKTDIPIVQSFEITSRVLGNQLFRESLLDAKEKIKKGVSIEESLRPYPMLFPPVVLQMIAVGEETGALDEIMQESASFYEEDVAQTMGQLPTIIEPILVVILGLGVGAMAVAVIMPMYSLSQQL